MSAAPCMNPNCKSYGRPHPNCKCHGEFAEGGEARFCAQPRNHDPDCEYFSDGGMSQAPQISAEDVFAPPTESQKWAMGNEDKEGSVASALVHSGANDLLNGTLDGAYKDPNKVLVNKGSKLYDAIQMRMMQSGEMNGLGNILNYTKGVAKGSKTIDSAVEHLFSGSPFINHSSEHKDANKDLAEFVKDGKLNEQIMRSSNGPQLFAEGGEALPDTSPMERVLPVHNMMINEAKARINGYLNSIRPVKSLDKLTFDTDPSLKDKEKAYNKALDLANKPISILNNIKKSTITPQDMVNFRSMYPEVYEHLSKKISERIVKSQIEEKKPPYHIRQGLSLFLGVPLDSTFIPAAIQSAQETFSRNTQGQPQQPGPAKSSGSKSNKSMDDIPEQFRTQEDAALLRSLKD